MEQFEHDFEELANCLTVQASNKLVLLNPHFDPYAAKKEMEIQSYMRRLNKTTGQTVEQFRNKLGFVQRDASNLNDCLDEQGLGVYEDKESSCSGENQASRNNIAMVDQSEGFVLAQN